MAGPAPLRMGLGMGRAVIGALERGGITVAGYRWTWRPGLKGGIFEEHREQNRRFAKDIEGFGGSVPQADVNGENCQCSTRAVFRGQGGRFVNPFAGRAA